MSSSPSGAPPNEERPADHSQVEAALQKAFHLPPMAIASLCRDIFRIGQVAPWIEVYFPRGVSLAELPKYWEGRSEQWIETNYRRSVNEAPVASALVAGGGDFVELLRALLVVAAFHGILGETARVPLSEQKRVAQLIRGFVSNRETSRALYDKLQIHVELTSTAEEFASQVRAALDELVDSTSVASSTGLADLRAVFNKFLGLLKRPGERSTILVPPVTGVPSPASPGTRGPLRPREAVTKRTRRPRGNRGPIRSLPLEVDSDGNESARVDFMLPSPIQETELLLPLAREARTEFLRRTWSSNQGLIRDHIESLSDQEAMWLAREALADVRNGLANEDAHLTATALQVLLTLALGYSEDRLTTISIGSPQASSGLNAPIWDGARLWIPVLRPEAVFKPAEDQVDWLEPTGSHLPVDLPPVLATTLNEVLTKYGLLALRSAVKLTEYMAGKRNQGPYGALTIARARSTARALIQRSTGDLPLTMLACADDFGQSRAPLHYTTVPAGDVATSYREAIWPVFGCDPRSEPPLHVDRDYLIGSNLLVKDDVVRAMVAAMIAPLRNPRPWKESASTAAARHNHLVNYCATLMLASVGHRPGEALLRLCKNDFSFCAGVAFVRDKQVDPTHWLRPAALPSKVVLQLEGYLQHLSAFAEQDSPLPTAATRRAEASLKSDAPLFFHLDELGRPSPLDWISFKASLPEEWTLVPLNWGRTYLARRLRLTGASGDDVLTFLGHLESALYPFSSESPVAPDQFVQRIRPHLDKAIEVQGITVERGFAARQRSPYPRTRMPEPLKSWEMEIQRSERIGRERQLALRHEQRAAGRAIRAEAATRLTEVLSSVWARDVAPLPLRTSAERSHALNVFKAAGLEDLEVPQEQISAALEGVEAVAKDQPALSIAARNYLYQLIRFGIGKLGWKASVPPPWLPMHRFEPSPFVLSMGLAIDQMMALREAFNSTEAAKKPRSFDEALARCVVALAAYSLIDSPDHILRCLASPGAVRSLPEMPCHFFLETEASPRHIHIDGVAALALKSLQQWGPGDQGVSHGQIDDVLSTSLPKGLFNKALGPPLISLCQTVRIFKIHEMSGLARSIEGDRDGSTHLSLDRYRSVVDGSKDNGCEDLAIDDSASYRHEAVAILPRPSSSSGAAGKFRELRDLLYLRPGHASQKVFSTTGERISEGQFAQFRNPMARAVTAYLDGPDVPGSCDALARYALHLLKEGTRAKRKLAHRTVYEYVTRIGAPLAAKLRTERISEIDPDDLAAIYEEVIEETIPRRVEVVAHTLMEFHRFAERELGAPPVPSVLFPSGTELTGVDARLVSYHESDRIIGGLRDAIGNAGMTFTRNADELRSEIQATVLFTLLKESYARLSEVVLLRFKDISFAEHEVDILIRPHAYRSLKTRSARRRVTIKVSRDAWEWQVVRDWLDAERSRLGQRYSPNLPIFVNLEPRPLHVGLPILRAYVKSWLAASVGYGSKVHHLRHHGGTVLVSRLILDSADANMLCAGLGGQSLLLPHDASARDAASSRLRIGHSRLTTTGRYYHHLPVSAKSRPMRRSRSGISRFQLAALGMQSLSKVDRAIRAGREREDTDPVESILMGRDTQQPASPRGLAGSVGADWQSDIGDMHLSASTVLKVLNQLAKGADTKKTGFSLGLPLQVMEKVVSIAEERMRHRLPPSETGSSVSAQVSVRKLKSLTLLKPLLALADSEPGTPNRDLLELLASEISNLNIGPGSRLKLHRSSKDALDRLLGVLGLSCKLQKKDEQGAQLLLSIHAEQGASTGKVPLTQGFHWTLLACHVAFSIKKMGL